MKAWGSIPSTNNNNNNSKNNKIEKMAKKDFRCAYGYDIPGIGLGLTFQGARLTQCPVWGRHS
jgi:hypothetical protein